MSATLRLRFLLLNAWGALTLVYNRKGTLPITRVSKGYPCDYIQSGGVRYDLGISRGFKARDLYQNSCRIESTTIDSGLICSHDLRNWTPGMTDSNRETRRSQGGRPVNQGLASGSDYDRDIYRQRLPSRILVLIVSKNFLMLF